MSWIESHQSLLTHRKTLRLEALLHVNRYQLIGHLHALWWWSIDNAQDDGLLGQVLPEEIAAAAGWPTRKASAFVNALTASGFLDEDDGDGFRLHNWYKFAGKLNEKRAKDRGRKAEIHRSSIGFPVEVAGTDRPTDLTNLTNLTNQPNLTDLPTRTVARMEWENRVGFLSSEDSKEFKGYEATVPEAWMLEAIDLTVDKADRPSWAYCRSVLKRCLETQQPPKARTGKAHQETPHSVSEVLARKKARVG